MYQFAAVMLYVLLLFVFAAVIFYTKIPRCPELAPTRHNGAMWTKHAHDPTTILVAAVALDPMMIHLAA